ncbi:MAG: aminopeptidase P family protein [Phycisphaera sp.]|nr:MAG: aminopeptidase P family protein [Phycisphaera sp.]
MNRTSIAVALLALAAPLASAQLDDLTVRVPHETTDKRAPTGDNAMGAAGPRGLITQEVYRERRLHLLNHMRDNGFSAAVIFNDTKKSPSGGPDRSGLDFYYLTGIEHEPGAALLLDPDADQHLESLYLPMLDVEDHVWHGERSALGRELELSTGFARVRRLGSLPGALASAILTGESNMAVFLGPVVGYSTPVPKQLQVLRDATSRIPGASVGLDREILPAMRQAKDEHEIELTRRAIANTLAGLHAGMTQVEPGMTEFELRTIIETTFHEAGSRRLAFGSIVGSGPNSCVLHYRGEHDHRVMGEGELVLCDVGAEVENYAADITRTFPISGTFTPRQREVYDVVLRAADEAIAATRPGVTFAELNDIARKVIEEAGYTDDMKHGLGHFLGLYVHDAGNYHLPLTPGTIITIEPGIYLSDENIGIRIEDDVLVTEDGYEVLTRELPRTADEVEAFMAGGE